MMHRTALFCRLLLAILLWAGPVVAAPADYTVPYNALLSTYVSDGQKDGIIGTLVNYKGWAEDKNHAAAVAQLSATQPEKLSTKAKTAFWINAYNLLVIDLIVRNTEKESIRNIGSVLDTPWQSFSWSIGGKPYTLKEIEQQVLISRHGDPRLYFALSNGTLSGPDLLMEAYTASRLDTQLDMQVTVFLQNDSKGMKRFGPILQVSRIFQQHAREFEKGGGQEAFIRTFVPALPKNALVQDFFDENGNLNGSW